jgi:hypothetical protein
MVAAQLVADPWDADRDALDLMAGQPVARRGLVGVRDEDREVRVSCGPRRRAGRRSPDGRRGLSGTGEGEAERDEGEGENRA